MLAGCIDRMASDGCAGCARRDPCRALFAGLSGDLPAGGRSLPPGRNRVPALFVLLGGVAKAMKARAKSSDKPFRRDVERRVEVMLADGRVRITDLARTLGMSRQTLYRRLKAEGTTFDDLVEGVRRRLAARLIDGGASVKETAYRLGFSDPSAFSRAYKRWTGRSPKGPRQPG